MNGKNRRLVILIGACLVGIGLFLGVSQIAGGRLGFPLDDAWIHQTYARNLANNGRFEFVPGAASPGSTSPLWTLMLTVGYLLGLPYLIWAYLLGGLSLLWLAWTAMQAWRTLWPALAAKDWLAGISIVLMWPLLWAAVSGMETLLFAALGMQIAVLYLQQVAGSRMISSKWLAGTGFLCGLLILARPDGVVFVALLLAGLFLLAGSGVERFKRVMILGATAVIPLIPYFLFNMWANGTLWPNTMDAKQTEYAALLAQPIWSRTFQLLFLSLGGPESGWQGSSSAHLLLLPGLFYATWRAVKADWQHRQLAQTLLLLWAGGHVVLYAWRLPVTYQHGRYLLAIIPVWVLYGLAGWLQLLFQREGGRGLWFAQKTAQLVFALMLLFFLIQGAVAYATDVAIIEGEMVAVGRWLAENTEDDALIATHDIGAIGYFGQRPLLDLAGLITPEIIPLLADETAVSAYVLQSEADYLVTAPGWLYTAVAENENTRLVFSTEFLLTKEQGSNNMSVYQLKNQAD